DSSGRAIEGLTAADFGLTEDGVPQTISFAEFQRIEAAPGDAPPAAPPAPAPPRAEPAIPARPVTQYEIARPAPGDTRYRDRRLVVLYFDLTSMPPPDQMRAYTAARKFLDSQITPKDLVAIMTFQGGAVRVKHDFTANQAELQEVITTLVYGEQRDPNEMPD